MAGYRILLHLSGFNLLIFCGLVNSDRSQAKELDGMSNWILY